MERFLFVLILMLLIVVVFGRSMQAETVSLSCITSRVVLAKWSKFELVESNRVLRLPRR